MSNQSNHHITASTPIILLMQKMITKTAIGYQNMNQEFKQYVEKDAARHL